MEKNGVIAFPHSVRDRSMKANLVRVFMAGRNVPRCTSLSRGERRKSAPKAETGVQRSSRCAIGSYAPNEMPAERAFAHRNEKRGERADLEDTKTQEKRRARYSGALAGPL